MSEDSTQKATASQAKNNSVANIFKDNTPVREYDVDKIEDFLNAVFHDGLFEDEHILTWRVNVGKNPMYPRSEHNLYGSLEKSKTPAALYFGTSTCRQGEKENKKDEGLRNRKDLIKRLHVVVLDDIGTKVPLEDMPEGLEPSYIIESSKGNFQWGLVLDVPLENRDAAEALVRLVYESGYSDGGGKMANKLVRLPEGVNGKKGDKRDFVTKLVSLTDKQFSPQEILDVLNIKEDWAEIERDADTVLKRRTAARGMRATMWSPVAPQMATFSGIVDPVLEALYEDKKVASDNGDWVTIKCPFAASHTSGGDTAGYTPIGRGEDPHCRGFHCFHDSCSSRHTNEFLHYMSVNYGVEVPQYDYSADLLAEYVFIAIGSAGKVASVEAPYLEPMNLATFRNLNMARSSRMMNVDGKLKTVQHTALWEKAPNRVCLHGITMDPTEDSPVIEVNGRTMLNMYESFDVPDIPIDMDHVKPFIDHVEYLIPDDDDRDYFMQWCAAKVQDRSFRGAGILMHTITQGVGRSTLGDMMAEIVGRSQAQNMPFNKIVGDSQFNGFMRKALVVCDEVKQSGIDKYRAYEKFKNYVDPAIRDVEINEKNTPEFMVRSNTSFLMFSNHPDAISVPDGDRRLKVIENPLVPNSQDYFMRLNEAMAIKHSSGLPLWVIHTRNWLKQQDYDLEMLMAPLVDDSDAKRDMIEAGRSVIDWVAEAILAHLPSPFITGELMKQLVTAVTSDPELAASLPENADVIMLKELKTLRRGLKSGRKYYKTTVNGAQQRVFIMSPTAVDFPTEDFITSKFLSSNDKDRVRFGVTRLAEEMEDRAQKIVDEALAKAV